MSDERPDEQLAPQWVKPDEDIVATAIAAKFRGKFAFFYGDWWQYSKGVWTREDTLRMRERVRVLMRPYRGEKFEITHAKVKNVEALLRQTCFVANEHVNAPSPYLNMQNGLFNLDTFRLEAHRADCYFTWQLPFPFVANAALPEVFRRYLFTSVVNEEGSPDYQMMSLIQEALGYTLTADTTRKVSFWVWGKPNSGKSQLIALIREMLGSMHATIDLNQMGTNRFLLANAAGKRAITFTEATVGSVLPDGLFKALVGGSDAIQADVKNRDAITFVPQCKVWWAMNEPPRVLDRSNAVYNRIIFILFPREIPAHEQIRDIVEKFRPEFPAIFWWMLEGLKRLRARGDFTPCTRSQKALATYRLYNDEEDQFIAECCVRTPEGKIPANELKRIYRAWRKDNGYSPKSWRAARRDFERLGITSQKRNDGNYYLGITFHPFVFEEFSDFSRGQ